MKNTFRLFIHSVLFCLIGVLFLTPEASFCADEPESEDMRQGNKAFSAGDYASAERFYKKALVLLDSPLWEKCMLQLSRVYLKQGDTASARTIGIFYLEGRGVSRSISKAELWLKKAAAAGDPEAGRLLRTRFR